MFNIWRPYPLIKPKNDGWYTVTLSDGSVMDLEYIGWADRWMDSRRKQVFDGYKVYHSGRAPIEENRVYNDSLWNRTDEVVAWKRVSKPFGWWWKNTASKE